MNTVNTIARTVTLAAFIAFATCGLRAQDRTPPATFVFMKGYVEHNFYSSGGSPESLLTDPNYPDNPTFRTFEPLFEYPPDGTDGVGSNYRNGLFGWFLPPQTTNYVFFIASDNQGRLYLSTNDDSANIRLIAQETSQSDPRRWTNSALSDLPSKRSDHFPGTEWPDGNTIRLEAGKRYFIEVLHSEGGEGDQVGATFTIAGRPDPMDFSPPAIGGTNVGLYLDPAPVSITFTNQPKNQTVFANSPATISVGVSGYMAGGYPGLINYQWQKASATGAFADIPGASGATKTNYTTPPLVAADDQSRYRVVVTAPGFTTNSAVAIVTVVTDNDPPRLISAMRRFTNDTQVVVVFSELIKASTANAATNYTINGTTVSSAALAADGKSVLLTVSPGFARGTTKTLTVSAVQDVAGNPVQANSQSVIIFERGALFIEGNATSIPIAPNAASQAFIDRLIRRGYSVKVLSSTTDNPDGSSANGMDLLVISSTIGSGNVAGTYTASTVPVLNWESNLQDDFGFKLEATEAEIGVSVATTDLLILDPSHPLAAGFPAGPVTVWDMPLGFRTWVDTNNLPDLIAIGWATNDATQVLCPAYCAMDVGARLDDPLQWGVATQPARRVMLPLGDTTALNLTENGWKLMDAAVDWVQHITAAQPPPRITNVSLANGMISIQWINGGTLQSTPSLAPAATWTNEPGSGSFTTAPVGPAKFYRVSR